MIWHSLQVSFLKDDEVYEHQACQQKLSGRFFFVNIPLNLFLVVCATGEVIVIFLPINLLIKVDFPTFGLPNKVTKPDL